MLKESLEAKNLLDALGSFSEDEGLSANESEGDSEGEGDTSTNQTPLTVSSPVKSPTIKNPPQPVSQRLSLTVNYCCPFLFLGQ